MNTTLSIVLLLLSTVGAIAAFGGDTWQKGKRPIIKRITERGWIALTSLSLALIVGVGKEITNNNDMSIAKNKSDEAQLILSTKLEDSNKNLLETKAELKEFRDSIILTIHSENKGIVKEIDHPYFETTSDHNTVVISNVTKKQLIVYATESIRYNLYSNYPFIPGTISFLIGGVEYPIKNESGIILVFGDKKIPMPVKMDYNRNMRFALKMTLESSLRNTSDDSTNE